MVKKRPGHAPERTCVGCGKKGKKSEFLRIVKTAHDQILVTEDRKVQGRSAYICRNSDCVKLALKRISKALKKSLDAKELSRLALAIEEQIGLGEDSRV